MDRELDVCVDEPCDEQRAVPQKVRLAFEGGAVAFARPLRHGDTVGGDRNFCLALSKAEDGHALAIRGLELELLSC